jgi:hypothetical protein
MLTFGVVSGSSYRPDMTTSSSPAAAEYLRHQYLYLPWRDGVDTLSAGKSLGLWVAAQHDARMTVVTPLKSNAGDHPELAGHAVVTERSGQVHDGGVVLAWCPTYKAMAKTYRLENSIIVLTAWASPRFVGWAKLHAAFNVVTGKAMDAGLSEVGRKLLQDIVGEGYNGWHDDIARRMTTRHLEELVRADEYDRSVVLAYAREHASERGIDRLLRILDAFDAR